MATEGSLTLKINWGLLKKFFVGAGCGVWASAVSSAFDRAHAEVRTGVGCRVLPILR